MKALTLSSSKSRTSCEAAAMASGLGARPPDGGAAYTCTPLASVK